MLLTDFKPTKWEAFAIDRLREAGRAMTFEEIFGLAGGTPAQRSGFRPHLLRSCNRLVSFGVLAASGPDHDPTFELSPAYVRLNFPGRGSQ